jgi:quinol monooxygenase YgiN
MPNPTNVVSVHPYFKVKPGKMDAFKAALPAFIEKATREKGNLYYDFTVSGDVAYAGAEGFLAHLDGVGAMLPELLKLADIERLEVHGPAEELAKLKGPLAEMKPTWFTYFAGVKR